MILALLTPALHIPKARAQGLSLITDAETENLIREYSTPLFQAAGLSPQSIRIFLVNDPALNAFVTAGNRMFINTGLIMQAKSPSEVIGVIAHETGHIAGGHVSLRGENLENSNIIALASTLLGVGVAIATGEGAAAGVFSAAGQSAGLANILSYSRRQEAAADQAAINYLKATEQSPAGLRDFMSVLLGKEVLLTQNQDPYLRTHPLTRDRVNFLDDQTQRSPYKDRPVRADLVQKHERVKAKLAAFLNSVNSTFRDYPESDTSLPARYARSIAYYKDSELDKALAELDKLIAENPQDPYFLEFKGQMLFEFGKGQEAIAPLEQAVAILPKANSIRYLLIRALAESDTPENNKKAMEHLNVALQIQQNHPGLWRQAAILFGRQDNKGMTSLALAERAFALGNFGEAIGYGERAIKLLDAGTPAKLRANDLVATARLRKQ
ncbi:M48 family metalloprotease [Kiloniella sp. b19]|uniref:M48 family metalloprotease n=1 Tax=Kiloniella sp. GXU_MW_B19 TaxID=3141326 RepID=UPI0031D9BFE1